MRQKNPDEQITWTNGSKKWIWNLKWDKKIHMNQTMD